VGARLGTRVVVARLAARRVGQQAGRITGDEGSAVNLHKPDDLLRSQTDMTSSVAGISAVTAAAVWRGDGAPFLTT
jgi:hypothetical protein